MEPVLKLIIVSDYVICVCPHCRQFLLLLLL